MQEISTLDQQLSFPIQLNDLPAVMILNYGLHQALIKEISSIVVYGF